MPLISVASDGVISVRKNAKDSDLQMLHFAAEGGVIDISNNTLNVLVDVAESGDDINEAEAKKAADLAQKMKSEAKDEVSLEQAQKLLDRSEVRLKVAELHKRRRRTNS
jgi:F0F1-type ATP synthase epsilon subunit